MENLLEKVISLGINIESEAFTKIAESYIQYKYFECIAVVITLVTFFTLVGYVFTKVLNSE